MALEDIAIQYGSLGIVAFVVYYTLTQNNKTLQRLTVAVIELTVLLRNKNGGK